MKKFLVIPFLILLAACSKNGEGDTVYVGGSTSGQFLAFRASIDTFPIVFAPSEVYVSTIDTMDSEGIHIAAWDEKGTVDLYIARYPSGVGSSYLPNGKLDTTIKYWASAHVTRSFYFVDTLASTSSKIKCTFSEINFQTIAGNFSGTFVDQHGKTRTLNNGWFILPNPSPLGFMRQKNPVEEKMAKRLLP